MSSFSEETNRADLTYVGDAAHPGWGIFNRHYGDVCTGADTEAGILWLLTVLAICGCGGCSGRPGVLRGNASDFEIRSVSRTEIRDDFGTMQQALAFFALAVICTKRYHL